MVAVAQVEDVPHAVDDTLTVLDLYKLGSDLATRLAIQAANASAETRWDNLQVDTEVEG